MHLTFQHPFRNWKDAYYLLLQQNPVRLFLFLNSLVALQIKCTLMYFFWNQYLYISIALRACWKINQCYNSLENNSNPIRYLCPFLLYWCQFASTIISSSWSCAADPKLNRKVILPLKGGYIISKKQPFLCYSLKVLLYYFDLFNFYFIILVWMQLPFSYMHANCLIK